MSARRTALVQGASRGIGLALATELLERDEVGLLVATGRSVEASPGLAGLEKRHGSRLLCVPMDVCEEASIARAAERVTASTDRLHLLMNCAGLLHDGEAVQPEKKLEDLDPEALARAFRVNAFGPLLVARHFLPLLRHEERSVLANLSARVGSIGDDRLGGWYAYRGSKAALNMFTRNLAIELRRRAPACICIALHPGTVDTALSRPFQGNVPEDRLFTPERAARQLLEVIGGLTPEDSGGFRAWDGSPIPW